MDVPELQVRNITGRTLRRGKLHSGSIKARVVSDGSGYVIVLRDKATRLHLEMKVELEDGTGAEGKA